MKNKIDKVHKGFIETAENVSVTLGANGGLGLFTNEYQGLPPIVTKDGISIARRCFPTNKYKALGASLAREISAKSLFIAGDGTTTSLVLAKSLLSLAKEDFNPKVSRGIEIAKEEALKELKKLSKPTDEKAVKSIATIATNNNKELGELLLEAYKFTGANGNIDVEENVDNNVTTLRRSKGMRLPAGWKHPFLTTNTSTATFEAEKAKVLVYEGNIGTDNAQEIVENFIDKYRKEPIVIFCEHISDDVTARIVTHFRNKQLNICVVEAPYYADQRQEILSDIALYTGCEVHVQGVSKEFTVGEVKKITIEKGFTSIQQDTVSDKVKERAEELKKLLPKSDEKEFLRKRISYLEGDAATILVGSYHDIERKEIFDRVDDAVRSVKSSLESGWIAGGGSALAFIANKLKQTFADESVQRGYDAFKHTLYSVMEQICKNSNIESDEFVSAAKEKYGEGFNAVKYEKSNLIKDGVIDSTKSAETAIINSVSVVNLLLNVKTVIV